MNQKNDPTFLFWVVAIMILLVVWLATEVLSQDYSVPLSGDCNCPGLQDKLDQIAILIFSFNVVDGGVSTFTTGSAKDTIYTNILFDSIISVTTISDTINTYYLDTILSDSSFIIGRDSAGGEDEVRWSVSGQSRRN